MSEFQSARVSMTSMYVLVNRIAWQGWSPPQSARAGGCCVSAFVNIEEEVQRKCHFSQCMFLKMTIKKIKEAGFLYDTV